MYSAIVKYTNGVAGTRVNGINLFSNTFSSDVQNTITSGLTADSINYILGQGGTTVKISIPTVTNMQNIAINKAEIVITQVQQNSSKGFHIPFVLFLLKRNSNGNLDVLPTKEGASLADSTYIDMYGNKISKYIFKISKYVQSIVNGKELNTDLYIKQYGFGGDDVTINNNNISIQFLNFSVTPLLSPYRFVFAGSNYSDPKYKMKFNLTYTQIR
jgi:hypothetical protein